MPTVFGKTSPWSSHPRPSRSHSSRCLARWRPSASTGTLTSRTCRREDRVLSRLTRCSAPAARLTSAPSQPEELAFAHAGGEGEDVEGFQPVALDRLQEAACLLRGEGDEVVAGLARWGAQLGGVADDRGG